MYNLIRRLHLFAAFLLAAFILMYFVSGFVMIFEDEFEREDVQVEKIRQSISATQPFSKDSLVHWVKQKFNIHGQYEVRLDTQQAIVNFWHPGTVTEVKVSYPDDSVYVTIKKGNLNTILNHFHRLNGYQGGMNYYAWAFMCDLSASSMIVFAVSGLYLWYKTERKRLAGWVVLITFTTLTAMTIIYLMFLS